MNSSAIAKTGAIYAILAYTSWGLVPLYWKLLGQVPAIEVLSHRIIWSMLFLAGLLLLQHRQSELIQLCKSPKSIAALFLTTVLVSFNWGLFIYSIQVDRVVEASLGYYINPLVSILLGFLLLKERFNRGQTISVLLATFAVALFVWRFGQVPWIAIGLAMSFALYGLFRKLIPVKPMVGLVVETLIAAPIALLWVGTGIARGTGHFGTNWALTLLLIGGGIITALPLLWFNHAAKRLRLSTMGFFQYIGPSLQLLLGVFVYHEPFTVIHGITFALIWIALMIYSATTWKKQALKPTG